MPQQCTGGVTPYMITMEGSAFMARANQAMKTPSLFYAFVAEALPIFYRHGEQVGAAGLRALVVMGWGERVAARFD